MKKTQRGHDNGNKENTVSLIVARNVLEVSGDLIHLFMSFSPELRADIRLVLEIQTLNM